MRVDLHSECSMPQKAGVALVNRASTCAVIPSRHRRFLESSCGAIGIVQRAAQALAPLDRAGVSEMARLRTDESVLRPR